jgi:hypothetical protein
MTEDAATSNYNGWANYETWAVKLWLDNEEASYRYWAEEARSWHGRDDAARGLARQLEEEVTEAAPLEDASLYSDLLRAALSEVDWFEIAESYLGDVEEEADQGSTEDAESCDAPAMPTPERRPDHEAGPARPDAEDPFGELIFAYARRQAIADGVLIDVTETAKEAGFKVPVALTSAAWAKFVEVPPGVACQDEAGRLWDVLWMCRFGIGQGKVRDASSFLFQLHVRNDNREGWPPLVTLKAVCGPDDDAKPCVTIMLPDED